METNDKKKVILNDIPGICSVHPGSILREELVERGIKQKDFAGQIGMEPTHLSALIHGNRNITPAIATRLEEALRIPATVWMNLQSSYNLDKEKPGSGKKTDVYQLPDLTEFSVALAEPDDITYGSHRKVSVLLPAKDTAILTVLAERLGWTVQMQ